MRSTERIVDAITSHTKTVIVVMLLMTAGIAVGLPNVEEESQAGQFGFDSEAEEAREYVAQNFVAGENQTYVQIVVQGDDVLTQESFLETLALREDFEASPVISETLADEPVADLSEIVVLTAKGEELAEEAAVLEEEAAELEAEVATLEAEAASLEEDGELEEHAEELAAWEADLAERAEALEERGEELKATSEAIENQEFTIDDQRDYLESMNESEFEDALTSVLDEDADQEVFAFLPTNYKPGSTNAEARTLFVVQNAAVDTFEIGDSPEEVVESQLQMQSIVDDRFGDDGLIYGVGIVTEELDQSLEGSVFIIVPIAFLFVVTVLAVAYRDLLDIILGVTGIALVLVWTYGFMGWTGIEVSQIMLVVPVLLIGLSIDYAIHVTMRHREQRNGDSDTEPRPAMRIVLAGLGVALVWVTITAMIGFLSNLTAPIQQTREFGIVTAFGIGATLLIFGVFLPAVKIELDERLEARGFDRRKRAFATGGGRLARVLLVGRTAARRSPWGVIIVVLIVTSGGAYGAAQVDTSFDHEDFIAFDTPGWLDDAPEPFHPGEFTLKESIEYMNEHFLREDSQSEILIQGEITNDDTLEAVADAETKAANSDVVLELSSGDAGVQSPLTAMERVAAHDEAFDETFTKADTTGDGVPNENLEAVYDGFLDAQPELAEQFVHRTDDGEYEALRMVFAIDGEASATDAAERTDTIADSIESEGLSATATGGLVVTSVIEGEMVNMVLESLAVSIVAIFLFGMIAYRVVHDSATLGVITLLPILLAVVWIFGTMALLDISVNMVTGTVATLTIGLGVAYNIHMSERFRLELSNGHDVWDALERSLTGTGGALLGSALTTAGGFGVLAFALVPTLQQFGIITAITIMYAFMGSVLVLPTLLVLWTRYLAPEGIRDGSSDQPTSGDQVVIDGGENP